MPHCLWLYMLMAKLGKKKEEKKKKKKMMMMIMLVMIEATDVRPSIRPASHQPQHC